MHEAGGGGEEERKCLRVQDYGSNVVMTTQRNGQSDIGGSPDLNQYSSPEQGLFSCQALGLS